MRRLPRSTRSNDYPSPLMTAFSSFLDCLRNNHHHAAPRPPPNRKQPPMGRANSFTDERGHRECSTAPSSASAIAQSTGRVDARMPSRLPGLLKSRYKDHPWCDLCAAPFDVLRRRHQCRRCGISMCSSCGPIRMMVPWVDQFEGARTFDQAESQRVCTPCSQVLQPLQAELAATYGRANEENIHTSKSRLHLPYTSSLAEECQHAADIIGNFFRSGNVLVDNGAKHDRRIPAALLNNAKGLAIFTVLKAGFTPVCSKFGTGLVVRRLVDGSWSAPSAISVFGAGCGFEIGGELIETVLVLGSNEAVEVFCDAQQVNVGAGVDLAVGSLGRSISVSGAASVKGSISGNYGYSQSRGLCVGVAIEGAVISTRRKVNRRFYGQDVQPRDLLSGSVVAPHAARPLTDALENAMRQAGEAAAQVVTETRPFKEMRVGGESTDTKGVEVAL